MGRRRVTVGGKNLKPNKLLVIVGATAVGKSEVAIFLAQNLSGEIIAADSMQVYKNMNIGTGKPSPKQQTLIRHHLIDVVSPIESFSVAQYQKLAREAVREVISRRRLPIIVGGTGLYVKAVIDELEFPEGLLDSENRKELEKKAKEEGGEALYQDLKRLDPEAAENIHPHNVRRIIRALEVIESTKKPFSHFQKKWNRRISIYHTAVFGLGLPREHLYKNIDKRLDEMIEAGLIDEVKALVKEGYREAITSKQALGYKELIDYLDGNINLKQAKEQIKQGTRNFAKRQLTWFKREPRLKWIDTCQKSHEEVGAKIISYLKESQFINGGLV